MRRSVHESTHSHQCLVAYITTVQGSTVTSDELQRLAKEHLPEYMIPAAFIEMEALPLTPNGKLDRRALPAPEDGGLAADVPYVAPRTSDESRLAEIWQNLLGLERVGIHDDFFLLGGHSLLTIRLMTQIEKQFGKRLPVT